MRTSTFSVSKSFSIVRLLCVFLAFVANASTAHAQAVVVAPQILLEAFPDAILASKELRDTQLAAAAPAITAVPFHLIVPSINRWTPGSIVRVAFNGGDPTLYAKIEDAASEWTKPGVANLRFQFKNAAGQYNHWSPSDSQYQAEIRISFSSGRNDGGYWSHVGTDSKDSTVLGGRPGDASMNFDSFDKQLPSDWRGVVMHEFGHAIGFQHEHQNPIGGCDFRFQDEPGYVLTKDQNGWYTSDINGKRPGLYTYLGGKANYWPKQKVDGNLRALTVSSAYLVGSFDKTSIMKYFFDAFMFAAGKDSPCFTDSENVALSPEDKAGARQAYSVDPAVNIANAVITRDVLNQLLASPKISSDLTASVKFKLNALQ